VQQKELARAKLQQQLRRVQLSSGQQQQQPQLSGRKSYAHVAASRDGTPMLLTAPGSDGKAAALVATPDSQGMRTPPMDGARTQVLELQAQLESTLSKLAAAEQDR
jgi:Tol biopolymer transport system component